MVWIAGCWDSSNILLTSHLSWEVVDFSACFRVQIVEKEGTLHTHVPNNKEQENGGIFFIKLLITLIKSELLSFASETVSREEKMGKNSGGRAVKLSECSVDKERNFAVFGVT